MDRAQVELIAQEAFAHWREELPLEDFEIELLIEGKGDEHGTCSMVVENRDVTIRIDPIACLTRKEIQDTVKHEMLHLLTAEFQLFWELVKEEVPDEKQSLCERVYAAMWELMLCRLERCWEEDE